MPLLPLLPRQRMSDFPALAVICENAMAAIQPASRITAPPLGKLRGMLAIIAAILFGIAFVINATGTATDAAFSVTGLLLLGLVALALHQAGIGSAWVRRR
jgi:hypothetical protein